MSRSPALRLLDGSALAPHVWRGDELAHEWTTLPSGCDALDRRLPGGGWPQGAITEILLEREGIGELRLTLPALARLTRARRPVVLVAPPYIPYAPALDAAGIAIEHLLIVDTAANTDRLWAFEQALRSRECGAAFAWLPTGDERVLRRLQIAAREGETWGVLWRRPGHRATTPTAALRLRLAPRGDCVEIAILKRRGGRLDQPFIVDVRDALGSVESPGTAGRDLHSRLAFG